MEPRRHTENQSIKLFKDPLTFIKAPLEAHSGEDLVNTGVSPIMFLVEPTKTNSGAIRSRKRKALPAPLPVERAIQKLGHDLSLARRRRHISQASLAERIGASLSTIKRMEGGDLRVPLHFIARALYVFGELEGFSTLLDTPRDAIGLTLMDDQLPKRIRAKATKRNKTGAL